MRIELRFKKKVSRFNHNWCNVEITSDLPNKAFEMSNTVKAQLEKEGWLLE